MTPQQQHEIRKGILQYFAEFGEDIGNVIARELLDRGGFPALFQKLGVPDPVAPEDRYVALLSYLRKRGTAAFLDALTGLSKSYKLGVAEDAEALREHDRRRLELEVQERRRAAARRDGPDQQASSTDVHGRTTQHGSSQRDSQPNTPTSQQGSDSGKGSIKEAIAAARDAAGVTPKPAAPTTHRSSSQETAKLPAPASPTARTGVPESRSPSGTGAVKRIVPAAPSPTGAPVEGRVEAPLLPAPPPPPGTYDARTPSWDPAKPHDPQGEWPAMERRSGVERRSRPDPRSKTEVVFKNRRYGKERRSGKERRRNWPKGGHKPPL